ncbi:protein GID8 homolog [Lactuca sativa]|uniref:Uncharacterized protein n=1 Tax=Lactuca sativa TaxID=4236 RepID=A0A9R1XBT0_LACSA|nr:protein GID8 homolog [Lactuca sativa]KAJ0206529.1 hypothetical protein LSAT_V11C500248110 [Lactuca sativa]
MEFVPKYRYSHNTEATEEKQVSAEEWYNMFSTGFFKKEVMDLMVMDYFVTHMYVNVAESFEVESGCKVGVNLKLLAYQKRVTDHI